MKRNLVFAVGALLLLASAAPIMASPLDSADTIKANIPFAFSVTDREMPAGNYELVGDLPNPGTCTVRESEGAREEIAITEPIESETPAPKTELVFDVIGGHHFLRKLYFEGETNGLQIAPSKAEQSLEKKGQMKSEHRIVGERAAHHGM